VHFTIKEVRSKRTVYRFASATRVRFEDRDVVVAVDQIAAVKM
jgi:hypothetical protein